MRSDPATIIVMGVTGSGKTVVGQELARALDASFIEGDIFHPPENIELMRNGMPLSDGHRAAWLDAIGAKLLEEQQDGKAAVAACSALKRSYRDRLRAFVPGLTFLFLEVDRETAERRVAARQNHFMPASLVASQFETLERPDASENFLGVDATDSPDQIVERVLTYLGRQKSTR